MSATPNYTTWKLSMLAASLVMWRGAVRALASIQVQLAASSVYSANQGEKDVNQLTWSCLLCSQSCIQCSTLGLSQEAVCRLRNMVIPSPVGCLKRSNFSLSAHLCSKDAQPAP